MRRKQPLSPLTTSLYNSILKRAFGAVDPPFGKFQQDLAGWPESQRKMLRAAITRKLRDQEEDPTPLLKIIPTEWVPKHELTIPNEDQAVGYEKAARKLKTGKRALALLPLAMGLRSNELLALSRDAVLQAIKTKQLYVMRKGGRGQNLPCDHCVELFEELLEVPAALPNSNRMSSRDVLLDDRKPWAYVGEILSVQSYGMQYKLLHRLVNSTGRIADLKGMRPHLLRHVFASRMDRDGATLSMIQSWLGHKNVATTQRYIHPDLQAGREFVRQFKVE